MNSFNVCQESPVVQAVTACLPVYVKRPITVGILALGLALSINNSPVIADTFTVTNTNDSGPGSLIEALRLASSNPGHDSINMTTISGEIKLNHNLGINDSVDILGPGIDKLSVYANALHMGNQYKPLNISLSGFSFNSFMDIFSQRYPFELTLDHIAVKGLIAGSYTYDSLLKINNSVISEPITGMDTGLTLEQIKAEVTNTVFMNNPVAWNIPFGGSVRFENCTIRDNDVAGKFDFANVKLINSTVTGNKNGLIGNGVITIDNSTLSGNGNTALQLYRSSFFDVNEGQAIILNSTINDNLGGGVSTPDIQDSFNSEIHLENTTISNNTGPGITFYGNSASINQSSIVGNGEGIVLARGLYANGDLTSAVMNITNSIISNNGQNKISNDVHAAVSHTLLNNFNRIEYQETIPGSNLIDVDPLLGVLASNGGLTKTHELLAGSPAIDAGGATTCTATDQRGVVRPQGIGCDMGAYEFSDAVTPTVICDLPPVTVAGNCAEEVVVRSMSDLDEYVASNFGHHIAADGKRTYKNLRLLGDLGEAGVPFSARSPCAITFNANSSITGSNVSLHARMGLNVNWSADIEASGEVCLVSDKRSAFMNGGNKVGGSALGVRGEQNAIIGFQSTLSINGNAEIKANTGEAKVGNRTRIIADEVLISGQSLAKTAHQAKVETTTGDITLASQGGQVVLSGKSDLQSGGLLNLTGKSIDIGFHTNLITSATLTVIADTEADCHVASITSMSYANKAGNCSDKLP